MRREIEWAVAFEAWGRRSRKFLKNMVGFGRLGLVRSGEIDEPLGPVRPKNWLIRRVRG